MNNELAKAILFSKELIGNIESSDLLELFGSYPRYFETSVELLLKVGLAYRHQGQLGKASEIFQDCININKVNILDLKHKFLAYEESLLIYNISQNLEFFEQSCYLDQIKINKPYLYQDYQLQESFELIEKSEFKDAQAILDKIIKNNPQHPEALFNLRLLENAQAIAKVQANFAESYLSIYGNPIQILNLVTHIINRIKNKIPTSCIRLGDGEGHFLPYSQRLSQFQKQDQQEIQNVWWGETKFAAQDINVIEKLLYKAIGNADIIGIPEFRRMAHTLSFNEEILRRRETRGLYSVLEWLAGDKYLNFRINSQQILTSHFFNNYLELWNLYLLILGDLKSVSLITCHDELAKFIQEKYNIENIELLSLKCEYSYKDKFKIIYDHKKTHYPDIFEEIMSTTIENGRVYLVAAGFLGKIYCDLIKEGGGIAIDVGSVVDLWMGYKTRYEHHYIHQIKDVYFRKEYLNNQYLKVN